LCAYFASALFAITCLAASPARADVVGPEPDSCPDGSVPSACHGGPYCHPFSCMTDADCDPGLSCKDRDLCTADIDCGGAEPYIIKQITGTCESGCAAGSTCVTQKVCVPPSTGTTTGAGGGGSSGNGGGGNGGAGGGGGSGGEVVVTGCACDLARGNVALGAAGGALFVLGLAGLGTRRRRRR
jgi:hypothetical protein